MVSSTNGGLACLVLVALSMGGAARAQSASGDDAGPRTGSVIFIHPDGTSTAHWTACRMLYAGPDGDLQWDLMPHVALYRDHVKNRLTATSHGGATVHAYGIKVAADSYGLDGKWPVKRDGRAAENIMRRAIECGIRCGIVNSGTITEPGTGVFAASVEKRADHEGIVRAMMETGPHVILGGGEQWFVPRGHMGRHGPGMREDGVNLIDLALTRGYKVVWTREELLEVAPGTRRLLGLFSATDTYNDHSEEELAAGNLPAYDPNAPTIAEMTESAIRVLGADEQQFFLVVEEEGTDNFGNANNARDCLLAAKRADDAIGVAREYISRHPRTLLVTAADSDAGGLAIVSFGAQRDPEAPVPANDENGAPLDGKDGTKTPAFVAAPDARGLRLPFAIAWATFGDVSGGILARAEGMNAEKLARGVDNTGIHRLMYATLFDQSP